MGFDSAWFGDHFIPYLIQEEGHDYSDKHLEPYTILPTLVNDTPELRCGLMVTCNSYRNPAILTKISSSIDRISGGRFQLGIGAGWYKEEYNSYGIPFPELQIRLEQFEEAVNLIHRIWTQDKVTFRGKYYNVTNLVMTPKPIQKPHPPIWIGGKSRESIQVAAKYGDYVNFANTTPEEYKLKLDILEKYCREIGRNFSELGKSWHGDMIIVDREEDKKIEVLKYKEKCSESRDNMEKLMEMEIEDITKGMIVGTAEQCVEKIQEFLDVGVDHIIPYFPNNKEGRALQTFTEKIVPNFK